MEQTKGGIALAEKSSKTPPKKRPAEKKPSAAGAFLKAGISRPENDRMVGVDAPMVIIVLVLLVFGTISMFSAGYAWAISEGVNGDYYFKRQLMMAGIGLVGMTVISFIDYHLLQNQIIVYLAYFGSLILMLLCFVPGLRSDRGAHRWIVITKSFEFQPSEIAKIAIVLLFAYWISINYSNMKKFAVGIVPFALALGLYCGVLYKQPHISALLIICAIGFSLMLIGGTDIKQLVLIGVIAAVAVLGLVLYLSQVENFSYFEKRWISWTDPFNSDYSDDTYQTRNSLIAIGSGGLFGLGLGNSRQKFLYLPESKNDFVFAIICEELGFIGAVTVILLFILFIVRGFSIAVKSVDKSGMLIACGITIHIGLQAFLNIGVVCNAIPNTGISLPFFSYGGTALIIQLCEMGILLNISRHTISEPAARAKAPNRKKRGRLNAPPERTM